MQQNDLPKTLEEWRQLQRYLQDIAPEEQRVTMRWLGRQSLYYLLRYILQIPVIEHPWVFDRCLEVQDDPDGHLDLWAREHFKSTIITLGLSIYDIIRSHGRDPDPAYEGEEVSIGIFSHTRPIATTFLMGIRQHLQSDLMLALYPDILWSNPKKDAPAWSAHALTVRRWKPQKEATVEAWGLLEGMPTGRHFSHLVYDDVITDKNISTSEMIEKTTQQFRLSLNLGRRGGVRRMAGTRYHLFDTYRDIITTEAAKPRIYPATDDGTPDGEPVLLTKGELDQKYREMGPHVFSTQMLLDPLAAEEQGFKAEWINYYEGVNDGQGLNVYILVDPAGEGHYKRSDYTAIFVVGLGGDNNYYILEMVRDRINLTQRSEVMFRLNRKWKPLDNLYESYGIQTDVPHLRTEMSRQNYHFPITSVGGTRVSKVDRIRRLIPLFEQGRFYFPQTQYYTGSDGRTLDLVELFREQEYKSFPVGMHPDMLDALSRITEPEYPFAFPSEMQQTPRGRYRRKQRRQARPYGWMAA